MTEDMEKRFEEGLLEITESSPPSMQHSSSQNKATRAHPGAALLSPSMQASHTPSIMLSPQPFSQYTAFDSEEPVLHAPRPMSPILDTSLSGFGGGASQRPLSAQDFSFNGSNGNGFDPFRPFSAQAPQTQQQQQQPLAVPERPLSSMEIDSMTFKNDVANLVNWMGTLTANQQRSVVDNLLSNVTEDILSYARTRIEELTYQQQVQHHQQSQQPHQPIAAPRPLYQSTMQEPVTLDTILNGNQSQNHHLQQQHQQSQQQQQQNSTPWSPPTATASLQRALSPNFVSPMDRSSALIHEAALLNRPRSADPYNKTPSKARNFQENIQGYGQPSQPQQQQQQQQQQQPSRAFDITNLAQQLTANGSGPSSPLDFANVNSLKLSALSTINSRVQLDSGKNRRQNNDDRGRNNGSEDLYNRTSSVPPPVRVNYYDSLHHQGKKELGKMASLNAATKALSLDDPQNTPLKSPVSPQQPKSPAINPKQITNPKLLQDIPAWLKTLRLHKYTPCLQDIPWKELIYLTDEQLAQKGVTAMGARGKLLKAFDVVQQYYEDGLIE